MTSLILCALRLGSTISITHLHSTQTCKPSQHTVTQPMHTDMQAAVDVPIGPHSSLQLLGQFQSTCQALLKAATSHGFVSNVLQRPSLCQSRCHRRPDVWLSLISSGLRPQRVPRRKPGRGARAVPYATTGSQDTCARSSEGWRSRERSLGFRPVIVTAAAPIAHFLHHITLRAISSNTSSTTLSSNWHPKPL